MSSVTYINTSGKSSNFVQSIMALLNEFFEDQMISEGWQQGAQT